MHGEEAASVQYTRLTRLFVSLSLPQAFELATGDFLFEPHTGHGYTRDEGWESDATSFLYSC